MEFVNSFQTTYQILPNLPNRTQTLNELKLIILQKGFKLPSILGSFTFMFENEQNILTIYSDDAYVAFVANILHQLARANVL